MCISVHALSACIACLYFVSIRVYVCVCAAFGFSTHSTSVDADVGAAAGLFCFLERASSQENFSCSLELRSTSPVLERATTIQ